MPITRVRSRCGGSSRRRTACRDICSARYARQCNRPRPYDGDVTDEVVAAVLRALQNAPDDAVLRLHVAEMLVTQGRSAEAMEHLAIVLAADPARPRALQLMASALAHLAAEGSASAAPPVKAPPPPAPSPPLSNATASSRTDAGSTPDTAPHADMSQEFDWHAAETEVEGIVGPSFVETAPSLDASPPRPAERPTLTLADIGGMEQVKERLTASFLAPLRNPQLRRLYGKRLRGGLLLYGPPGCGKTHLARALAGELQAAFLTVSLHEVLDPYLGRSESNLHQIFQDAREHAPCVLFLDEIDGLGQRRAGMGSSVMRGVVTQLLEELDGIAAQSDNEGVYVLAATNQPWDVDAALRRPGRLDRTVLVLPPDRAARDAIFRANLRDRPIEGVDVARLAERTDGYSGADIAHVCETASERALLASVRTGETRLIQMSDLLAAVDEVRPSVGDWLASARNVALFGNTDGMYDELKTYLKRTRRL